MINGKQCTVLWHINDIKISHEDPKVVTAVLALLKERCGKKAPLTITCGKKHDYLEMMVNYSKPGKVKILMIDFIKSMLSSLSDEMNGEAAPTPAANHLFQVNEDAKKLDEEMVQLFHHNVVKLLFLCKRAWPDAQTAVSFLITWVQEPGINNYKKL
jgi:hypothetical protein